MKMKLRKIGVSEDLQLSWWKPPEKENERKKTTQEHKECLFNDSYIHFS